MADQVDLPLYDVVEKLIDYRGRSPKKSATGIPVISAKVVKSGRILENIEQTIAPEYYEEWMRRGLPEIGDVVMTTEGPMGEVAQLDARTSRYALGQRIVTLRGKPGILHNGYLKFLLMSPEVQARLEARATGTTVLGISQKQLRELPLPIMGYSEQEAIAALLGALDDKIELNRRMSATLEEMARALYRSWFVDFDPAHARALGQPPAHMDPTTAALFPDSFAPDGLPKGWQAGTLGDIASNIRRQVQPGDIEAVTPYIGLEHMPRRSIALSDWGEAGQVGSAKSAMRRGQILFGKLRPYFHKVGIVPTDGICSTDILVIDAKANCWREMVLNVMSSDDFVEHANATSSGTRMPRSNWKELARFDIAIPPETVAEAFSGLVQPMTEKIVAGIHEAHTLASLRDTLLPRLMSGELRIREAEKQVEEVV